MVAEVVRDDESVNELVPLNRACRLFATNPSVVTIIRWFTRGVIGPDRKTRVVLKAKRIGGRTFITRKAADDFIRALNAESVTSATIPVGDASKALQALLSP